MNDYIPDMTERFPEGLRGVDMTENYFERDGYDPRDYEEEMDIDDVEELEDMVVGGEGNTYYFVWAGEIAREKWYIHLSEPSQLQLNSYRGGYCLYTIKTGFIDGEEVIVEENYNNGADVGDLLEDAWNTSYMIVRD